MSREPVLVGELNPYGGHPHYALFPLPPGSAGGRLQSMILGIKRARYVDLTRVNLCVGRWSAPEAREAAARLRLRSFVNPDGSHTHVFILLGAKVCAAFGVPFEPFVATPAFVILPHPSGRNRAWNAPDAIARARATVGQACPDLRDHLGEVDSDPPEDA